MNGAERSNDGSARSLERSEEKGTGPVILEVLSPFLPNALTKQEE